VFPLEWTDPKTGDKSSGYREAGYLPEAVVNFLALLGWNPGDDREVMSLYELISAFSLDRVSKSGAKFDYKKGEWFNHQYIQQKSVAEIAQLWMQTPEMQAVADRIPSQDYVEKVVGLVRERVNYVKDLWDQASYFFVAPTSYDEKTVKKRWKENTPALMEELITVLQSIEDFSAHNSESIVIPWIQEKEYNMGAVMNAFRLALVGESKGPHIFDITEMLGKDETIDRIRKAISDISKQ
ncbi:glutamate--tRNA ligase, partial [Bacteroidales bacterium OttesenSCG-928-J19]|nr:glutamate--tRNA ligase [Bacteroidales bacterium OttesenSCG-928-J19]